MPAGHTNPGMGRSHHGMMDASCLDEYSVPCLDVGAAVRLGWGELRPRLVLVDLHIFNHDDDDDFWEILKRGTQRKRGG